MAGKPLVGGPVTVTADVFKTFVRYHMECVCGWSSTEDNKDGRPWSFWLGAHFRSCSGQSATRDAA